MHTSRFLLAFVALLGPVAACSDHTRPVGARDSESSSAAPTTTTSPPPSTAAPPTTIDIYSATRPNQLDPAVASFPSRVYVPNTVSNTVDVIDPATFQVINSFPVDAEPHHVVPSWDLKTLYVNSTKGYTLTPIDPATGTPGTPIPVDDPYNLYFTPDGRFAIVVAEALNRLDFRDPHTWELVHSVPVPCGGVNHMDFSAAGDFLVATCEFSWQMVKVSLSGPVPELVGAIELDAGSKPQDVKTSPDGAVMYVAEMLAGGGGVWLIDPAAFTVLGFVPTGAGAHGLYVSRDSKDLYVSNRDDGSVSVIDLATRQPRTKWVIPDGGSPDMGGVSADGTVLWLAGRDHDEVYAFDTTSGALLARIPVGAGPHGVCVYPQPGRFSMGHTGVFR